MPSVGHALLNLVIGSVGIAVSAIVVEAYRNTNDCKDVVYKTDNPKKYHFAIAILVVMCLYVLYALAMLKLAI